MALDLMMEHLTEIPHIDHLATGGTLIEMVSLVLRLTALPIADDLTGLDH